jgi:hydrogenase expression/formation protein HypD
VKYLSEFRDPALAQALLARIAEEVLPERGYRLMEFCGGHTHALARYGIPALLPANVRMVHGPGCPVCVLPTGRIDQAIRLALEQPVILCGYGDVMRVPGSNGLTLLKARARGADIRMVYSPLDALELARRHPEREVVFFAIGFETTTPPSASAILQALAEGLTNFSVLCHHVLTLPAMQAILDQPGGVPLDGLIGPAHVSTVIGSAPYLPLVARYRKPLVVAGFEPLDLLQAILMLVRQVNAGRAEVENEFTRAVLPEGNRKAQALVERVFAARSTFEWRGLGELPDSGLTLRQEYAAFDAEQRFPQADYRRVPDHKGCECAAILRGEQEPPACRLFGKACTPEHPLGACMVSAEGACAASYTYGRVALEAR